MSEILLINPPSIKEKTENIQPIPYGLLSIKLYLEQKYFQADILNFSSVTNWEKISKKLQNVQQYKIIGITCYTRQRFSVLELCKLCKKLSPTSKIVLGGPHVSFLDETYLLAYSDIVDFIIRGEGEVPFHQLVSVIINGENTLDQIDGLSYHSDGRIIRNEVSCKIAEMDTFPIVTYSLDDLRELNKSQSIVFHFDGEANELIAPIMASRGCNGACSFCCNKAFWGEQRYFSRDKLLAQVEHYYSLGIRLFDIYDDNFPNNKDFLKAFCTEIIKKRLDIGWWCSSRIDALDEDIIPLMKKAGCFLISFGLESGSQIILDNLNKKLNLSDHMHVFEWVKASDIDLRVTISIGHCGESHNTITETITALKHIKPNQVATYLLKVYPGTPLYDIFCKQGCIEDKYWLDYEKNIVPFFTYEHSIEDLQAYQDMIVDSLRQNISSSCHDELDSVELKLLWKDSLQ